MSLRAPPCTFEKAVALNPDFAPAWSDLAKVYTERPETQQKGLAAAKRASALAPGEGRYQAQVAALQDLVDHPEEARRIAARAAEAAADRASAARFSRRCSANCHQATASTASCLRAGRTAVHPSCDRTARESRVIRRAASGAQDRAAACAHGHNCTKRRANRDAPS